jgi:hypothetical protein
MAEPTLQWHDFGDFSGPTPGGHPLLIQRIGVGQKASCGALKGNFHCFDILFGCHIKKKNYLSEILSSVILLFCVLGHICELLLGHYAQLQ